ncbi:cupin domain-containing protein [Deinococcus maricopensis]|uniref:Cupin 2 conserved barrel domain protein n=1 Tax=Deinococcus maricopensis (strain DSM 21211 / LMG 22137 / NRRL B-23946 / LB-34) TaxID=709986 RepID=E8U9A9_DEIML|nr:cupin domain-containing protein [Deinococcus maricopensis]ADV67648.1 Cupin 2 conserved barrel domain protein [Deinococcus maricopensis DSM 21211]
MNVIRAHDTHALETPNGNHGTSLATPHLGANEVTVVRQRQVPGGFNPTHTQTREEIMVMLAGHVTISSNEARIDLAPGDTLIVPPHTPHRVDNAGPTDAEWLIISAAGMQFFRETGEEATPPWIR